MKVAMSKKSKLAALGALMMWATTALMAQSEVGELQGVVLNSQTNTPVPFASVALFSHGHVVMGGMADFEGKYRLKPIKPGTYDLRLSCSGYSEFKLVDLEVHSNKITFYNAQLIPGVDIVAIPVYWEPPIIEKGETSVLKTLDAQELRHSAITDIRDLAATSVGVIQKEEGGSLNIRGSRTNGTVYIVDGVRSDGDITLPRRAIAEINIITGGIPAMFGDVTGGIVVITTKSYMGSTHY